MSISTADQCASEVNVMKGSDFANVVPLAKNWSADLSDAPRLVVFGGAYSNRHATGAMRAVCERAGVPPKHVICTGDVVAYGAHPQETVDAVRDWGIHVIAGNCEQQLGVRADSCACGFGADTACDVLSRGWYAYADASLNDDARRWMRALPDAATFTFGGRRARVIHGGMSATSRFLFASDTAPIKDELQQTDADIILAGHCGIPFMHREGDRCWVNPGVIGMPANDGTPDGWYSVLEVGPGSAALVCTLHRLVYDAGGAADAIARAGYADPYARALTSGRWPSEDILPEAERSRGGVAIGEEQWSLEVGSTAECVKSVAPPRMADSEGLII
ncbi:MAG: metallophosphoesterase family protein [Pseudomonadota bacterium]